MTSNVISTGSTGNAVVLNDEILIDCGVPFRALEEVYKGLKLVLLTHIHGDHFNPTTIKRLHFMRPALRFCVPPWLVAPLQNLGVSQYMIDAAPLTPGSFLSYGSDLFAGCERIPHDVENCCWHIWQHGERAFYATDCGSLDEIEAKDYDLYLIEANHTEAEIAEREARKLAAGEYSYEARAAATHLSKEQADEWLSLNAALGRSKVIYLHQHQEREADNGVVRSASDNGETPQDAETSSPAQS